MDNLAALKHLKNDCMLGIWSDDSIQAIDIIQKDLERLEQLEQENKYLKLENKDLREEIKDLRYDLNELVNQCRGVW